MTDAGTPHAFPVPIDNLFHICRFCRRMAEQWDHSGPLPDPDAVACMLPCGGPSKGMFFPLYHGPLTDTWIANHCVVCGDAADKIISAEGERLRLGVCVKHLSYLGIRSDTQH